MTAKATTHTTSNLTIALNALNKELGAEVSKDELAAYLAELDAIVATMKAIREPHMKAIRNMASKTSRAKKAERVAKALALLEAAEAADAE